MHFYFLFFFVSRHKTKIFMYSKIPSQMMLYFVVGRMRERDAKTLPVARMGRWKIDKIATFDKFISSFSKILAILYGLFQFFHNTIFIFNRFIMPNFVNFHKILQENFILIILFVFVFQILRTVCTTSSMFFTFNSTLTSKQCKNKLKVFFFSTLKSILKILTVRNVSQNEKIVAE